MLGKIQLHYPLLLVITSCKGSDPSTIERISLFLFMQEELDRVQFTCEAAKLIQKSSVVSSDVVSDRPADRYNRPAVRRLVSRDGSNRIYGKMTYGIYTYIHVYNTVYIQGIFSVAEHQNYSKKCNTFSFT